jgi:hypothetical protein
MEDSLNQITCQITDSLQLHCDQAMMAIVNQSDGEIINEATKFQKREIVVST